MNIENTEAFSDALSEIDTMLGEEQEDEHLEVPAEDEGEEAEDDADLGEDAEEGEESEDEELEEAPKVEAPHSWAKEDKALFESLPPEAQQVIAKREKERDAFVNQKAQEAASTRRMVETEARDVISKMYENHARDLQVYAAQVLPQAPDERLLYSGNPDDVIVFQRQQAAYNRAMGQQQELHQQIAQAQAHQKAALEQSQQAEIQADAQRLRAELPEWFSEDTGPALQRELQAIGAELGYSAELMNEASSGDILALKKASEWKAKAEKFDALQSKKMEAVRAAKGLPKMAKPGSSPSKRQVNAVNSQKAWNRVKANPKDGNAIADWLGID